MSDTETALFLVYLLPPVATMLSAAGISYWIYRRCWEIRGARTFVVMLVFGGLCWQPMVVVQLLATDPALVRGATVVGRLFGWAAVMSFVVFAAEYTTSGFHRRRSVQAMITLVLGGFLTLVATSPFHSHFTVEVRSGALPFSYGTIVREPVYLFLVAVGYALVVSAYYLVLQYLLSARDGARVRVVLITLGTVIVAILNLLSIGGVVSPPGFEYAAYGALPFIVFSTVAIFRLGLLDIVPVARRSLVESLTDPVVVVTDDHRVADFNRAATTLWPALSTRVGDPFSAACPELDERVTFPETGTPLTDTVSMTTDEGTRHYSVLVSPVQQPRTSGLVGYSILVRDVTELEASRRALERQNEQLDRVAATVSHDLRNPLTVASGHTAMLRERLQERGADDLVTHVEQTETAHRRMDAIIEDVLTITRAQQAPPTVESVALEAVARDAWATVATETATLEIEGSGTLQTDRGRFQRLLENLFRNSVEHGSTSSQRENRADDSVEHGSTGSRTESDDSVEHETPADRPDASGLTVSLDTHTDGETVTEFAVADDGPGIPSEIADTLFEYGETTSDEGTGIGLATVERLAESLGWTVTHDATYTDGARFVFTPTDGD